MAGGSKVFHPDGELSLHQVECDIVSLRIAQIRGEVKFSNFKAFAPISSEDVRTDWGSASFWTFFRPESPGHHCF